jgi:hypothetical protein
MPPLGGGLYRSQEGQSGPLGDGNSLELLGEARLAAGGGVGVDDASAGGAIERGLCFADEVSGVVRAITDGDAGVADRVRGAGANWLVAVGAGCVLTDALARR